jgi:hypothetical protein
VRVHSLILSNINSPASCNSSLLDGSAKKRRASSSPSCYSRALPQQRQAENLSIPIALCPNLLLGRRFSIVRGNLRIYSEVAKGWQPTHREEILFLGLLAAQPPGERKALKTFRWD